MAFNPFRAVPSDAPRLFRALDELAPDRPLERKVLVAGARGAGREILRTLARMRGGWTGFVVETPRPLALQLATTRLARAGLRVMDEFEEQALVDEAVDVALDAGGPAATYADLAGGPGFRSAVRGAVSGLRLAGVTAAHLRRASFQDEAKKDLLAGALSAVEQTMRARGLTDVAGVLGLATRALRDGEPLPADRVYLLPGLSARGASGRFVEALRDRGAEVLVADAVEGIDVPPGTVWRQDEPVGPRSFLADPARATARPPTPGSGPEPPGPTRHDDTVGLPLFADVAPAPNESSPSPDHATRAARAAGPLGAPDGAPDPGATANIELFHAAGVQEELREVLRRILASGRRLDEVEIVTPDPGVYGPALHTLGTRLEVGVTYAVGLPVGRTGPGRAVAAYLRWIADDFPSRELHRLLENDDLQAPGEYRRVNPRRLARRLRRLRIGWGRERYRGLIEGALERLAARPPEPRRWETPEGFRRRLERERRELEALLALVRRIFHHTPRDVPRRLDLRPRPVAPSALAAGLATFLKLVPTARGSVDDTARERLLRILDRIRHTLTRPAAFGAAVGVLTDHLDIRVPAPRAEGKAPWLSDGGSLHLSDLEHGGLTGRPLTFIVGMDAGRFPGGDLQDPLLLDRERLMLSDDLPTAGRRLDDRRFRFAALFARLRGRVVLSYPAWDAAEARVLSPSPALLQAFRLATGDPDAGFEALREHLGPPTSRIPRQSPALDGEDVWLGALARERHLLEGVSTVRAAFPRLDAGLDALTAWDDREPGPRQGLVPPRASFDPRTNPETVLSASRLETLGACPLRYFYRYVLRIFPPDDPEYQPDTWLNPLHRGSLLHEVFEAFLRRAREEGLEPGDEGFEALGRKLLTGSAARTREEIPPPSEAVYAREMEALRRDLHCFVEHLRRHPPRWIHLERTFGRDGEPPVVLQIGDGTVRVRGAMDRVDRSVEGDALRIVDYKTGGAGARWSRGTGTFHGGRRLQHLLYTLALEALEDRPVEAMEYHFPSRKGEGQIRRFERRELAGGTALVAELLDAAARGRFVPTDDAGDCRFCDYKPVCRVVETDWGLTSPPAAWGARRRDGGAEAYEELTRVRGFED